MTHKFSRQEATATRLIEKNGFTVSVLRRGAVNEATNPPTVGADTPFSFQAVQTRLDRNDLADGNVQASDIKLLLATGSTDPTPDDRIAVSGTEYSIVLVERVAPAGVVILWKIIARAGT